MADSSNYKVPFARRRKQKTDYDQRLDLVKSGKPRAVVRLSNNHTRVHLSVFDQKGDRNKAQTISRELEEHGWDEHTGNLPAAYLTGYLAGMKTDIEEAILDKGLRPLNKGGRIFAAVQGLRDAGVDIAVGEEVIPEESRIRGEHIEEMKDSDITETFEEVKENIEGEING
ncbi:MAG: 50S ribosomal protein L18 [Candidatus Nanohaloarchaea archaeon]